MTKAALARELAATANKMFAEGHTDPSAEEVAQKYYSPKKCGEGAVADVVELLPSICQILRDKYHHPVCLVGERYYESFQGKPPENDADARRCLPSGPRNRAMGIRLTTGDSDLIYQANIKRAIAIGGAILSRGLDRAIEGWDAGLFPQDSTVALIKYAKLKSTPKYVLELKKLGWKHPT